MRTHKGEDIAERLLKLAAGVLRLARMLARGAFSRHVGLQVMRAATGAGANYEEARGAESRADFIHKLALAIKELREASYWLRVVREAEMTDAPLDPLIREAHELISILVASRNTALANRHSP